MFVMDVRLPPQPAVPVVAKTASGTCATTTERTPADQRIERPPQRRRERRGAGQGVLTSSDLELIAAVTGERLWEPGADPATMSDFARQIADDRRAGRLPDSREAGPSYLVQTGRVLAEMGSPVNPFTGELLARALRFLADRGTGRIDVAL